MILTVTRHGETDYNVQNRYAGSTDVPLNALGLRQAEELAARLVGVPFDVIVCSTKLRARQTADILRTVVDAPLVLSDAFVERHCGVYEGLTREECRVRYPELWARQCTLGLDDAPTGGETLRQMEKRVVAGLEGLRRDYPDSRVLLVCHGFVSRVINRYYKGLTLEEMTSFLLGNCELAEYEV